MVLKDAYLKKTFFLLTFFVVISFVFPSVSAVDYYADVDISVDESGFIDIDGDTNHPDLLVSDTELYISKDQSFWLVNISKNDFFSDFVFRLFLPEGASISYVKSSGSIRIEEESGRLVVVGFGSNSNFSLLVQYELEQLGGFPGGFFSLVLLAVIVFLVVLFVYFYRFRGLSLSFDKLSKDKSEVSFKGLNSRQKEIMKLLIKSGSGLTQTEIQRQLGIPKASVSRNIRSLELKDLVEKEKIGMSNIIRVKKE